MTYEYMWVDSPTGKLKLVAQGAALAGVLWEVERLHRVNLAPMVENCRNPVLEQTATQLAEYFAGQRQQFDLPLVFKGTDFQRTVWNALLTIPFGQTRSYGEIASQIGSPKAMRAVGAANGRNPISIITPCHRVIGASGTLTGFAGGLQAKQILLALEAERLMTSPPEPAARARPAQGQLFLHQS